MGQRGVLGQVQSGLAKSRRDRQRAAVQCHPLPADGRSWGDSRSKQMSGLCCRKEAAARCPQGLDVNAVHYSSHHTITLPSCLRIPHQSFLCYVSRTSNVCSSDFCIVHIEIVLLSALQRQQDLLEVLKDVLARIQIKIEIDSDVNFSVSIINVCEIHASINPW